jgi:hypothetical protein
MSNTWFPGADLSRKAPIDGGSILGGKPKCVWHDTETSAVPSYSTGYFPNMTIMADRAYQHIPADRAARALRNESGGVQTNRWNAFQIEIVGWVNKITFRSIYRDVAQWLKEARGCPLTCTVDWLSYDSSYGNSRVRLSGSEWLNYSGHLGHMHVPENAHGDPGWPFPIKEILSTEDDMPLNDEDKKWILAQIDKYARYTARWVDHGLETESGTGNHHRTMREELAAFKAEILEAIAASRPVMAELRSADYDNAVTREGES